MIFEVTLQKLLLSPESQNATLTRDQGLDSSADLVNRHFDDGTLLLFFR